MRILHVVAECDGDAINFDGQFAGQPASEIINAVEQGIKFVNTSDDDGVNYYDLRVIEVGDVDPRFIKFVKDEIVDYDIGKDTNFYTEFDIIGDI